MHHPHHATLIPLPETAPHRLSDVAPGERVRFLAADMGGRELQAHLASMGLHPGVEIQVVRNQGRGPFVILVHDTRLMLGQSLARRIRIAPLNE
ncbi:MAG TPA: FeoA family protein [Candidatus Sumerlaeota bacterium]|nr:FeoA family protein [Candidatus Sumerlaeota bacterium]HPS01239.1 FeoA family protein [Candidatus Sumerlaeota bacterium]